MNAIGMNETKLRNYFNDRCLHEDSVDVEKWLAIHADTPEADLLLRKIFSSVEVDEDEERALRAFQLFKINTCKKTEEKKGKSYNRSIWTWAQRIAAVMLIPMFITTLYFYRNSGDSQKWIEAYAPLGKTCQVTLPDNTKIWLKSGSTLIYPDKFNNETRQVYLTGEAYAEVEKDKKKPFILSAGGVLVRVLGTKFNVKSYAEDMNAEVSLVEGSVKMLAKHNGRAKSVMLTPGDIVKYDRQSGEISKSNFEADSYSGWYEGNNVYFLDEPLSQIAATLEKRFNVKIVIENEKIKKEKYYAVFINNESLDNILRALNTGKEMVITRKGNNIYISK